MNNIESHLSAIQVKEQQLETLSEMIDKEGLTQCIRLLSTYIAMYKKDFGELSRNTEQSFHTSVAYLISSPMIEVSGGVPNSASFLRNSSPLSIGRVAIAQSIT